ncbi:MAG: hypothetical protein HKK66_03210 [Chlorobiaceae bacterium]|nr:hypothetical protein [Chlorobiaceae bacterium]
MHVKTQILNRVVTLLTGLDTTGNNVFQATEHPETPDTMPGITISFGAEGNIGGSLRATEKSLALKIGITVKGDDHVVINQVHSEVESALYGDFVNGGYLNGLATNLIYSVSRRTHNEKAALKHTVLDVEYKVEYQTEDGNADESV